MRVPQNQPNKVLPGTKIPNELQFEGLKIPKGLIKPHGTAGKEALPGSETAKIGLSQKSQLGQSLPLQDTNQSNTTPFLKGNPGEPVFPARELFSQTAAALGLPKDPLSMALLAFTRFFSLSPSLLGNLRRETLLSLKASGESPKESSLVESRALALTAALDKGLSLSPAALELYARYFVPPVQGNDDKPQKEREDPPPAEELQAIAEEEAEKDDLLSFLNYLPGKNGQKWMVYSFCIRIKGIDYNVILRILKQESGEEEYLIADISDPKRQWRSLLKRRGDKFSANIRVYPKISDRALKKLAKKAETFLGEGFGEILVQNEESIPSWVDDLYAEPLPIIDKEV